MSDLLSTGLISSSRSGSGSEVRPPADTNQNMRRDDRCDARRSSRWRRDQLVESGFALPLAADSRGQRYDLHALIDLVERGCAPTLAVRILAPIEEDAAA